MFKNKKVLYSILSVVLILAATIFFVGKAAAGTSTSADTATVTTVEFTESVDTSGLLKAQSAADLVWKTSGTVAQVNVKVGDRVKAGDILLMLDTTSAPANVISAQADLVNAKQTLEDVQQSRMGLAQAQQDLANAIKAVDDATDDVTKLGFRNATDDLIQKTQAQIALDNKTVSNAEDAYKAVQNKPDGDSTKAQALYNLTSARQARDQSVANYNWYTGSPDSFDAAKYRAALALAEAQRDDAQREVNRLKDGPTADDIAAAQAKVDAAQATVNTLSIIAPFDGEVLAISQNAGDVVSTGTLAIQIANRTKLYVDTEVDEADISLVAVGDSATVTMDALPGTTLTGTVTFINPVGQTIAGLIKYIVRVQLDPTENPLLLGATSDVTLLVGETYTALAVPASTVQSDKTGEYVMLITPTGNQRVDVRSSASVGELVIVTGDLKVGDQLVSKFESGVQMPIPGAK